MVLQAVDNMNNKTKKKALKKEKIIDSLSKT
jgi:hypothetical protein